MTCHPPALPVLSRPRLLVEAARIGADALARAGRRPTRTALSRLLSEEWDMNRKRENGEADYSPRRHLDLLIAVLAVSAAAGAA